ncbi:tyrosine-type recombinase/integrase [Nocardioides sp. YIM 152588]|uniref:tyrosine-type recombinase/integrase n=1 Tax=Nocardioides sp. YIM 152588 TaxID=3158259 RepID=UPI0032E49498
MGRQKLLVGTFGDISCSQRANGSWQARARYCDVDGVVREYRKAGASKNKAKDNLKRFFAEHTGTFGDEILTGEDTVLYLLELWFEKMEQAGGSPNRQTLKHYQSHVRWVLDSTRTQHPLGAYQVRHVRPAAIQASLDSAAISLDMRKKIRSILIRAFDLAIFHEAINGNPASAVPSIPVPRVKKKPVPAEELDAVRAAVREWAYAEKRNGPRSVDLPDIVEMLVATGMRIGELLALRWSDIELTRPPERRDDESWMPWLMVTGQVTSKGKRVGYGKTDAAIRPIALPDWAVVLLLRRKVAQPPNDLDAVFITRNGTWHFPTNVQGRLRRLRVVEDYADLKVLQDVTPHSFRRTVATEIDEVYDAEAAKNQLGHTSSAVTERHYINRKLVVPDYRAATARLAPGARSDSGPPPE